MKGTNLLLRLSFSGVILSAMTEIQRSEKTTKLPEVTECERKGTHAASSLERSKCNSLVLHLELQATCSRGGPRTEGSKAAAESAQGMAATPPVF